MNMKKIKKFFTLSRRAEGFTLVELIVVIAILAILGGVALPAYSGYIEKTNRTNDEVLAGEIKRALTLAQYGSNLQPGSAVVVYHDETKPVTVKFAGNDADGDPTAEEAIIHNAMAAVFGEGYADATHLSWNGWASEMSVAADSDMMAHVNASGFGLDNLGSTLDQVQTVVDAASGFFENNGGSFTIGPDLQAYLDKAGVDTSNGINASNANAVANALVFTVADNISNSETSEDDFYAAWAMYASDPVTYGSIFEEQLEMDPISAAATKYAATLALAQHIDKTKGTNYASQMGGDADTILNNQDDVMTQMQTYLAANPDVMDSYAEGVEHDSMAFLGYMSGVTSSADSMLKNESLNKENYFADGVVLDYVKDYISISDVLANLGVDFSQGAFVFIFNGNTVSCLPIDY